LLRAGACEKVETVAELAATLGRWLGDPNERQRVGEQGRAVVEKNRGALQTVLAMVDRHLQERPAEVNPGI